MDEVVNADTAEKVVNSAPAVVADTPVVTPTLVTPADTTVKPAEQWYGNDWREKMAGGDAKELARLARFTDPGAVYKSYRSLEGEVSSGKLKQEVDLTKLDEAGLAEWRKSNGVPETPDKYDLGIPEGLVLSEEDEVILGTVLTTMHKQGRKNGEAAELVSQFLGARELAIQEQVEKQKVMMVQAEEQLRQEWQGQDYLTNLAAVKNMLASAPEGIGNELVNARLPDGSLVGSNPQALKWLASMALELNPAGTIVPGTGANQMESIQSEKQALEQEMKKDINAWRKNDTGRARHLELIRAEQQLKSRGY